MDLFPRNSRDILDTLNLQDDLAWQSTAKVSGDPRQETSSIARCDHLQSEAVSVFLHNSPLLQLGVAAEHFVKERPEEPTSTGQDYRVHCPPVNTPQKRQASSARA